MRCRVDPWHRRHVCLAALTLCAGLACGTTGPDLASPTGHYQLQRVNDQAIPAVIFVNQSPYFKQLWRAGTLTIEPNGRWTDSLSIETETAETDTLETVKLTGEYTAYPDHIDLTVDPGTPGSWQAVENVRVVDGLFQVPITPTTSLYFGLIH